MLLVNAYSRSTTVATASLNEDNASVTLTVGKYAGTTGLRINSVLHTVDEVCARARSISGNNMNLKIEKGIWKNEVFDSGTLDISFSKNRMIVENCHFKSGDDYLLISGSWLSKNKYKIVRLQSAYQNNYLVNSKPIFINYQDTTVIQ